MTQVHEERQHYQLEAPRQALDFVHANHELALWYFRALIRGRVSRWLGESRQFLRDQKVHDESVPVSRSRGLTRQSHDAENNVPALSSEVEREAAYLRILTMALQLIEHLTNEGITTGPRALSGRLRLNTQTSALRADVLSPVLNFGFSYLVLSPAHPLPFSGLSPDEHGERLAVWGERSIPALGVSGAVLYQYGSRNLSCLLVKTIFGPLSGQLERAWNFSGAGLLASRASLSMSVYF